MCIRDRFGVGAQLVPRASQRRSLLARHLQLDQTEGQSVDESEHVRTAGLAVFLDAHLVDDDEVVALGMLEVDQPCEVMAKLPSLTAPFDRYASGEQPVYPPVLGHYVGALGSPHGCDDLVDDLRRQLRIEPRYRRSQPALQQHVSVGPALALGFARCDVGAVQHLPVEIGEVVEADLLDARLGDKALHTAPSTKASASWTRSSPESRRGSSTSRSSASRADSRTVEAHHPCSGARSRSSDSRSARTGSTVAMRLKLPRLISRKVLPLARSS